MILDVPYIDQSVKYPTGCESVSTVMLLQYLGYKISVDEFIENYLEQDTFEQRRGEQYGPDPRKMFCGSPYDEESFGCYSPVIVKALNRFFEESEKWQDVSVEALDYHKISREKEKSADERNHLKYRVVDETGKTAQQLVEQYVKKGMPVIFWACIDMREPIIGPEWKLKETGETFTWISNEHCLLLVGEDETGFYFNDPHGNHGVICYEKKLVENRHKAQMLQAVAVIREKMEDPDRI